jgi:hypothetical protein
MARGSDSKKRRKNRAKPSRKPASTAAEPADSDAAASRARADIRPYIYAVCDLVLVVVWAFLLTVAIPNRHAGAAAFLWIMVAMGGVMGAAMLVRNRWGWRVGAAACAGLIAMWIALVVILLMTAGFLSGVYGGFGKAAAMGTLGIAFLTLQLVALLPAFQLKYLMTRAGRRHFSLEPLWK